MNQPDILDRIKIILQTTDMTAARLSSLAASMGIKNASESVLSRALKSGQPLSEDAIDGLSKVCSKLERLIALVHPLKLSFQDVAGTKTLLQKLDRGVTFIAIIDDIEAHDPPNFAVVKYGTGRKPEELNALKPPKQ